MSETATEPATNGLTAAQPEAPAADSQSAPGQLAPAKLAPKKAVELEEEEEEEEDEEVVVRPNMQGGMRFIPQESSGEIKPAGPPTMEILGSSRMEHHESMSKKMQSRTEITHKESESIKKVHTDVQESQEALGSMEATKAPEAVGQSQVILQQTAAQQGTPSTEAVQQHAAVNQEGELQSQPAEGGKPSHSETTSSQETGQEPESRQEAATVETQVFTQPGVTAVHVEQTPSHAEQSTTHQQQPPHQQTIQQQHGLPQPEYQQPQMQQQVQNLQEQQQFHQKAVSATETTETGSAPQTINLAQQPQEQQPQQQGQHEPRYEEQQIVQQHTLLQQGISPPPQSETYRIPFKQTVIHTHEETDTAQYQQQQSPSHRQVQLQPVQQDAPVQPQPQQQPSPPTQFQRVQLHEAPSQPPAQPQQQVVQQQQVHLQQTQTQQQQQQQARYQQQQQQRQQQIQYQQQIRQPQQLQQSQQPQQQQQQQYYPQQTQLQQQSQDYRQEQRQYQQKITTSIEPYPSEHPAGYASYGEAGTESLPTSAAPQKQVSLTPNQSELAMQPYIQRTRSRQEREDSYKLTTKIAGDEAWIKEERASSAYVRGTPWSGRAVLGRQKQWPPPETEKVYVPYKSPVIETPQRRFSDGTPRPLGGYPPFQQPSGTQQYYQTTQEPFQQQQQWQQPQPFPPTQPTAPIQAYTPSSKASYAYQSQQNQQHQYQYPQQYQPGPYQYALPEQQASEAQYESVVGPKPWAQYPQSQPPPGRAEAQYQPPNQYDPQQVQQYFEQPQLGWIQYQQRQLPAPFQGVPPEGWRTTTYEQTPGGGTSIVQEQQFRDQGIDPARGRPYTRDVHAQRSYSATGPKVTRSWGPPTQQ